MKTAACTPGAGCRVPEGAITDLILKELWLFISICLVAPGRTGNTRACLCFTEFRAFPGLGWLPKWHLPKALKGKSIGSLGQGIAVRTSKRQIKKPGKKEFGKGNLHGSESF